MAKTATGEISLSIGALEDLSKKIAEADTQIAAATGSEAQIKKAYVEQVVAENAEAVGKVLARVIEQLQKLDTNILVGLTSRLEETLKTEFAPKIDEYVSSQVKDTAKVSDDELTKLKEARKALVEQDKAIRTILSSFGLDTSTVPEPKRGGGRPAGSTSGSGAKSGKNKENYQFTMDGKDRPSSQNTFSSLAYYATTGVPKALGQSEKEDDRWGAKQLKEFLASQNVKFGEDDTWEVTLPNNRKIGARRLPVTEAPAEATTNGSEETTTPSAPEPANA